MSPGLAAALADATMVLHFVVLAYIVFGGFLVWRWRRAIWPHLLAAAWGAAIVVVEPLECPLTYVENHFRALAGDEALSGGFIDTYIEGVLYPERHAGLAQASAALVVALSWLGAYLRWRGDRAAELRRAGADRVGR
ncbi:MAG TPA: DUF2784 domain-containing protein [Pseudonocardiaceae bacterium]